MSKWDDLINELCPNGVERKKIKDTYKRLKGTPITAAKMKEIDNPDGAVRIFAGGKTVIDAFEEDIPKANITRVPAVLVQSRGIIDVIYYDKPFTFKNEMWAYTADTEIEVRYLYHVLKNNMNIFRDAASGMGSLPQISLKVTEEFELPVPPLEVQREIVHILDSFTLLIAELIAELTARKKQYEFYRDTLLDKNVGTIKTKKLSEIVDVRDGTHDSPKQSNEGYPLVTSKNITDGKLDMTSCYLISKEDYISVNQRSKVDDNNILFSMIGTIGEMVVAKEPINYAIKNIGLIKSEDEVMAKYLMHYLSCGIAKKYIAENIKGTAPKYLSLTALREFPVLLPTRDVQIRLVEVLDNFDSICADLNIGLPAEINARQKQYESYRDALLTYAATGQIISRQTDRQTDRQSIIKLIQYVFVYAPVTLEDISINCDSQRKPVTSGNREKGNVPYYGASGIVDYVKDYIFDGDYLLVSEDGANLTARVTPIAFSITGKTWVNNHAHVLKFDEYATRRYVEIYLNSIDLSYYITGAAQPKLNQKNLNMIEIPLPSLEEQKRIVEILDRFDTLCTDISEGLPAEINARQKQYEYYRDKLLTFKEIEKVE
ncbi:hypothetical protein GCM10008910_20700 [Faecalicatena orotica]|uniref:Type I restriction enzyme S subunit n=1 Tax=Faecalicatena orotica TaxID=1544 RepID=A0A2Y9B9D9_9FIRM|nr:restriction endonuclease subunit S [Faecalicatena orotica]PWJ32297.1 type I restriction enzyme S subunit [Faecalicatena orotica]SSA54131.1 type I restriction enzyme, S subunit [Faecalicatena orotica]